jgi:CHAT domain-containing protein/Tfp pilus assembly protein PilF
MTGDDIHEMTPPELRRAAHQAHDTGDLRGALALNQRALAIDERLAPGSAETAEDLSNIGSLHQELGNLTGALGFYQRALAICERLAPQSAETAIQLNNIGTVHRDRGELASALSVYERALAIRARVAPESAGTAVLLNNLGTAHRALGHLAAALSFYERALAVHEQVAPESTATAAKLADRAVMLNNIGFVHQARGDLAAALSYYERALALRERAAPESTATAAMLNNIGFVHQARGDLAAALSCYDRALAIRERLAPESAGVANILTNMGQVYHRRGDLAAALSYHERAYVIDEQVAPGSAGTATDLNNIAFMHRARGDLATALSYLERALAIHLRIAPESAESAAVMRNMAIMYRARGDLATALSYLERALAIHEHAAPDSADVGTDLNNIGAVHRARGDLATALSDLERALAIHQRVAPESAETARVLRNIAAVYRARGDPTQALRQLDHALDIIESLRIRAGAGQAQEQVFAEYAATYGEAMACVQDRGGSDACGSAFHYAERSRARVLVELLEQRRLAWRPGTAEERELFAREEHARRQLADMENRLAALAQAPEHDGPALARAQMERQRQRRQLEEIQLELDIARGSATRARPEPVTLDRVREQLAEDMLLLEYAFAQDRVLVWAVRRTAAAMASLPDSPDELDRLVEDSIAPYRKGERKTSDAAAKARARLSRVLFAPVGEEFWAGARRVLVIPDGRLHYLPFELLAAPYGEGPLRAACTVAYAPSATVFVTLRQRPVQSPPASFIAFAPSFGESGGQDGAARAAGAPPRWRQLFGSLSPLTGAREEVRRIGLLFDPVPGDEPAQPATEWRIKKHAPGRRYVHIATHGVVQDGDPLFASGLLLDPPAPGEPIESEHLDDFLQTYEMFDLELDAEVVVLSACDTGLGLQRAGEGLVGISRALFFAGARCLVLSLWPVADLPTRQLMEAFYESLRANTAAATALSQAKELLRRELPEPYFWAGFICTGFGW